MVALLQSSGEYEGVDSLGDLDDEAYDRATAQFGESHPHLCRRMKYVRVGSTWDQQLYQPKAATSDERDTRARTHARTHARTLARVHSHNSLSRVGLSGGSLVGWLGVVGTSSRRKSGSTR